MGEFAERLLDGYVERQAQVNLSISLNTADPYNHGLLQYLGVLEQGMSVDALQKRSVVLSALDSARVS